MCRLGELLGPLPRRQSNAKRPQYSAHLIAERTFGSHQLIARPQHGLQPLTVFRLHIHRAVPPSPQHLCQRIGSALSDFTRRLLTALFPSLEESPAEKVAFPPESSNLMY